MTELKGKLIEAIKNIDFGKLSINELKTISEIAKTTDELNKADYMDSIVETMKSAMQPPKVFPDIPEPKTLFALKED